MENSGHSFISYFKRATSSMVVLHFLRERPMYGYEIGNEMKVRSGGKYTLSILYPILYRLEEQGYISMDQTAVSDGRARSYYRITADGLDYLEKTLVEYRDISEIFAKLVGLEQS